MPLQLGCDIVHIPRFGERIRVGGEVFLATIFSAQESDGASLERLAGMFAAKEAACKALGIPAGQWLQLQISREENGAPRLRVTTPGMIEGEISVSISHDGEYAFAVVAL